MQLLISFAASDTKLLVCRRNVRAVMLCEVAQLKPKPLWSRGEGGGDAFTFPAISSVPLFYSYVHFACRNFINSNWRRNHHTRNAYITFFWESEQGKKRNRLWCSRSSETIGQLERLTVWMACKYCVEIALSDTLRRDTQKLCAEGTEAKVQQQKWGRRANTLMQKWNVKQVVCSVQYSLYSIIWQCRWYKCKPLNVHT